MKSMFAMSEKDAHAHNLDVYYVLFSVSREAPSGDIKV